MNTKDFLRLGVPLGEATRRATDFVAKYILGGGDKSRLHEEVAAIVANPPAFLADESRKDFAKALLNVPPPPRAAPVKYRQWGEGLEHDAVMQMEKPQPGDAASADEEIRHPLVLEFLGLRDEYSETDLEAALIQHLETFLLELPTGIFYAQGVKANVLFFDRKPAQEKPWTQKLWIYDLRTNLHFTLKENTLKRRDLDDFVNCYFGNVAAASRRNSEKDQRRDAAATLAATLSRHNRKESERFKSFTHDELTKRDKVTLDIFWLKDDALEESANLPAPKIIAADITADLEAAMEQFSAIAEDLKK